MKLEELKQIMLEKEMDYFKRFREGKASHYDHMQESPEAQVEYNFKYLDLEMLIESSKKWKEG